MYGERMSESIGWYSNVSLGSTYIIIIIIIFFFNDTATTEIYTLSLHDALPIWLTNLLGTHIVLYKILIARPAACG